MTFDREHDKVVDEVRVINAKFFPEIPADEDGQRLLQWLKQAIKCDRRSLLKRVPITQWLLQYQWAHLPYDLIAGITVALTAIPQGIAYAVLAGLPPQYGLYSEIMPGIMYMLFGGTKYITIGPTAIMALMVQSYVMIHPSFAVFAAFVTGSIILLLGIFNLGFIVDFISLPVTAGFTAAAAITIASNQVKNLLGIPGSGNEFLDSWISVFKHVTNTKLWDCVVGGLTIALLLVLKRVGKVKKWPLLCKYLSLSRNAIVVILGTLIAFLCHTYAGTIPFAVTGQVASGFPSFQLPPFSAETDAGFLDFWDMAAKMGTSLITIPIVSILEMVAVAKAFSHGSAIDASQELIGLGTSCMMGSFVSGMPVTGSFTRTALNDASGVRTPLGGIFTSVLVLSALGLLTDTFYYIPKAVLAAVIVVAVLAMIEYHLVAYFWRVKKSDLLPLFITLIAGLLLGLDLGIIIGVASNLLFILQKSARPNIYMEFKEVDEQSVLIVQPDQNLFYASSEYLRSKVIEYVHKSPSVEWIIFNGNYIHHLDATVATVLKTLVKDLCYLEKRMIFWKWNRQPLGVILRMEPQFHLMFSQSDAIERVIVDMPS